MRIAFIHPFLYRYPRGIERFTFCLANTLAANTLAADALAEVHLLTWRWPQPISIDRLHPAVRLHVMPTARYYTALVMIPFYAWHLWRQHYDFVWINFAGYGEAEALSLVHQLVGQPFGVVFHYPYAQVPHRYREFKRYGLINRARHIVAVSAYVAEGVQTAFGRASTVIHHGVDTTRFRPNPAARAQVLSQLQLAPTTRLLVTTAALEERKGVQWVLRALPQVLAHQPDTHYVVLGDGPHLTALQQLTRELNLTTQVHWLGAQAEVVPYLQAADAFVILARGEASSLAALEALACGLPVLASQQPPFAELISAECGALVDETEAAAVAHILNTWLTDEALRQRLGQAGIAHVQQHFRWEHTAAQFIAASH